MYTNTVLRALRTEAVERLHLRAVKFPVGYELEFPGKPIERLCFVETGMASMTTTFRDGAQVEVGMFGSESIIGVSALMGTKRSLNRVYTQIEGAGFVAPVELARQEFRRGGVFQLLALRYVQTQLVQAMQSAGCNARHSFEQRLARWLLICADRVQTDTFKLSQEYVAQLLGGTRSTVSIAASALKASGLVDYRRGTIQVLDAAGLELHACECYRAVKEHLDNYAEFDTTSQRDPREADCPAAARAPSPKSTGDTTKVTSA
jgi:CRP-like cAMP-binding protein